MRRREFLKRGVVGMATAWGATLSRAQGRQRNVVLVVADDMGLQVGCYGDPVIRTPNLDALAAEGTRFSHAFCTTASCSASRSVILTGLQNHANGQYGHQHDVHNFHTFAWVRSLPRLLAEAGYRTAFVGKMHVQPEEVYPFEQNLNQGIPGGSHNPVAMAEKAREFLLQRDSRPFFLYFCPTDPHRAGKGFANEKDYPGVRRVVYDPERVPVPSWLPDLPETRSEWAEFYQAISRFDQGIGRLVEVLQETGHWEDTLILVLSDNGPPWPGAKTTLYEPGVRLPLIVRSPDQRRRGVVCDALVTWADLLPTVLEFAGVKGPEYPLHGRSFLPILEESHPQGWDEVYLSHTFHEITMYYPMRAIRTRRYKYILNLAHPLPFPFASDLYASATWQAVLQRGVKEYGRRKVEAYLHRPRHELYDLEKDPDEAVNLAEEPQYADILAELQGKLQTWQEKTKDPWRVKYRYE